MYIQIGLMLVSNPINLLMSLIKEKPMKKKKKKLKKKRKKKRMRMKKKKIKKIKVIETKNKRL
jgi:hypothetical protein